MEERRNDVEIRLISQELKNLSKQFDSSEKLAAEWRARYDTKIDSIDAKIDLLPCERGAEESKSMQKDIGWLQKIIYSVIVIGVPSLLGLAMAWGALNNTVSRNNTKWDTLDKEHVGVLQDVSVLKSAVFNGKLN